jgi:hypothetical protein
MSTGQFRSRSLRFRAQCGRRATPPVQPEEDILSGLIEEVRQLRAAVALYRHVVERLQEQQQDLAS